MLFFFSCDHYPWSLNPFLPCEIIKTSHDTWPSLLFIFHLMFWLFQIWFGIMNHKILFLFQSDCISTVKQYNSNIHIKALQCFKYIKCWIVCCCCWDSRHISILPANISNFFLYSTAQSVIQTIYRPFNGKHMAGKINILHVYIRNVCDCGHNILQK